MRTSCMWLQAVTHVLHSTMDAICMSTWATHCFRASVLLLAPCASPFQACFLFLFPTKALAQDQLKVLRQLLADAFGPQAAPVAEVGLSEMFGVCGSRLFAVSASALPLICDLTPGQG